VLNEAKLQSCREPSRSFIESMTEQFDIAVVGSGAAGIAAAISASRSGCSTLCSTKNRRRAALGVLADLPLCAVYMMMKGPCLNNGLAHEFAESLRETEPLRMGRVGVCRIGQPVFAKSLKTFWQPQKPCRRSGTHNG